MFDLAVLDLVFICNGLVCIFCVSLDHFGFVFSNCVLFGSFFSTKIGWEERLLNDLLCVQWVVKP